MYVDPEGLTGAMILPRPFFGTPKPRPFPSLSVKPSRRALPDTHVPVDPSGSQRCPEDDDCEKEYFFDRLKCAVIHNGHRFSRSLCETRALIKRAACKLNSPPDDWPSTPNTDFDFRDPGYLAKIEITDKDRTS